MNSRSAPSKFRQTSGIAAMACVVVLAAAGCSSKSTIATSTAAPAAAAGTTTGEGASSSPGTGGKVKVALVLGLTANPFMQEVSVGSQDAADELGGTLTITGPPAPNPTVGVNELKQVVAQGMAGVSIMPLPATLWSKGISDAAAKTKVNTINTLPVQGSKGAETYIGINDAEASTTLLDHLFTTLGANPTGEVVLGTCIPGVSALDTRTATYVSYLKAKAPNVKVIGPLTTTTDPSKNLSTWQQAYAAHPKALAYIGNCDNDGPSLGRMHQQHPGKYLTATFDVDPSSLTSIKGGSLTAAIDESPYARGYLATAALILQAQGKPAITGFINVKGVLVTPANVDAIIAREATPTTIRAGFAGSLKAFLANSSAGGGPVALEPIANAYKGAVE